MPTEADPIPLRPEPDDEGEFLLIDGESLEVELVDEDDDPAETAAADDTPAEDESATTLARYLEQMEKTIQSSVYLKLMERIEETDHVHAQVMAEADARTKLIGTCVERIARLVIPDVARMLAGNDDTYRMVSVPDGVQEAVEGPIRSLARTAKRAADQEYESMEPVGPVVGSEVAR